MISINLGNTFCLALVIPVDLSQPTSLPNLSLFFQFLHRSDLSQLMLQISQNLSKACKHQTSHKQLQCAL